MYKFYFGQCFTILFKFSSVFIIFWASLIAFLGPWKWNIVDISSPYSPPWLTCFLVAKMSMRTGTRIEIPIQLWYGVIQLWFLLHMDNHPLCTVWISTHHRNSILVQFVGWLFHALQTLVNQWLSNEHINMLSSNILSLGSFFS